MKRLTTALLAAFDALIVVAIGVGIALVPLTVLWATQFDMAVNWLVFWRAAVDVWLVGNGVDLVVQLDPTLVAALNLPGSDAAFPITIALLGFALMAVLFGLRTGRRAAETPYRWVGVTGAIAGYALLTALLVLSAGTDAVRPQTVQGLVLPPLIFAAGVLIGAAQGQLGHLIGSIPGLPGRLPGVVRGAGRGAAGSSADSAGKTVHGLNGPSTNTSSYTSSTGAAAGLLPVAVRAGAAAALRSGTAAAAGILFVSGITVFVLILTSYATIIGLYETVQAGVLGGIALTLLQLALIPNLVIWAAAWFAGPGIAVGVGTSVSPVGTSLGAVPGLPILGVLPQGSLAFGFVGLLVPLLVGFLAAVILRQRATADVPPSVTERLLTGLGAGFVAGVLLGLLAWWSGGALGPGRLVEVGPNPLLVGALVALEVGIAACLGLLTPAPPVGANGSGRGATGGLPGTKPGTKPGTASRAARSGATGVGRLLGRLRDALPRR
ncbi:hypothetical protein E3O53_08525 [Cryobacterium sp. TMT2-18-3]|uniref:cell division protein PerM n=1 Tax=unclassified Cryobacterium TaxID=2649013 RepID=UPI00106BA73A|nr:MULTISPECIES: DUF6350 family protein [unclassified Cryobacterium]TFC26319.1 hypothetical protein E3O22_11775 [Cryobacterium sp. TMT2-18-2]TFC64502.1 hypothetical protein E3O53_08525 [Cryobacterium sp. TMT2-18-3]